MREQWLDILTQRQEYLDQQLQKIVSKPGAAARSSHADAEMIDHSNFLSDICGNRLFPPADQPERLSDD